MKRTLHPGYALAALAALALFATLGTWQLQRGQYKAERLDQQASAERAAPVALADALRSAASGDPIRQAEGRGRFIPPLLLLDNQQRDGRVGVRVYGLARIEAVPEHLLVDLGWLPMPPDRTLPRPPLPPGEVAIEGLLAPWPGQGMRLADHAWQPDAETPMLLNHLDPAEIRSELGVALAPVVMRLAPALDYGHERDLDLLPNSLPPERHYGYAVQWFALALTVAIVYFVLSRRRARRTLENGP